MASIVGRSITYVARTYIPRLIPTVTHEKATVTRGNGYAILARNDRSRVMVPLFKHHHKAKLTSYDTVQFVWTFNE